MPMDIELNGKEVTNPLVKIAIAAGATLAAVLVVAVVVFVVLPLIGMAVTLGIGLIWVVLLMVVLGIPLIILFALVAGVITYPFSAARKHRKKK